MRRIIAALVLCLPAPAGADWADDIQVLAAKQTSAVSAVWTTRRTLTVRVRNEASSLDDYASYYCLLFTQDGLFTQGTYRVLIRDAATDQILGEAACY